MGTTSKRARITAPDADVCGDEAIDNTRESVAEHDAVHVASYAAVAAHKKAKAKAKKAHHHKYVKGENTLRSRIHKALKVAAKSMGKAHGKKQKLGPSLGRIATLMRPRSGQTTHSNVTPRPLARWLPGKWATANRGSRCAANASAQSSP